MTPRDAARAIWQAALAAADVRPLVQRAVRRVDDTTWEVAGESVDVPSGGRVLVVGCGKASAAMAATLETIVGDRLDDGLVVVKDGYRVPTRRVRILEAGHPVPDARGEA